MTETSSDDKQIFKEEKEKAETLFSKKFREYLTKKKSEDKCYKPPPLTKDYSASSGETTASESSRKSGRKVRKKLKNRQSHWDFNYAFRNRLTQCSLLKNDEGVAPPEDLKPLLLNMTILLQDLKQSPSELENLYNLISKITILVTEFIRRPLKKISETTGDQTKKVDKTIEMMMNLLQEYKNGPNLDSDNRIREFKQLEKEIANKTHQITEVGKKLSGADQKSDSKIKDLNLRVRNSIIENEKLKSEIKFNQSHVKKYKKVLLEKEWLKHKLENELSHLRKKISKADLCDGEPVEKQPPDFPEPIVHSENIQLSSKNKNVKMKKGREVQKSGFRLK